VQARIDEITKKFEEQHAALEAKIAEEKANLEVKLAEAAEASEKKFSEEKAALQDKIAELEAKRDELEAKCVHSIRVCSVTDPRLAKVTEDYSTAQKAHSDTTDKLAELERTHSRSLEESTSSRSSLVAEHEAKIKE
jgi:chromosome segregation ATPase